MRGEHYMPPYKSLFVIRIIPACAGSTHCGARLRVEHEGSSPHARGAPPRPDARCSAMRDHPRMRGEHGAMPNDRLGGPRIIPACAGSTGAFISGNKKNRGSSPHARGARYVLSLCALLF